MGSVVKERRERSRQPAPDKWIYKGGHTSVMTSGNTAADLKIWSNGQTAGGKAKVPNGNMWTDGSA